MKINFSEKFIADLIDEEIDLLKIFDNSKDEDEFYGSPHWTGIKVSDSFYDESPNNLIIKTLNEKAKKFFPQEYFEKLEFVVNIYVQICDKIHPCLKKLVAHYVYFEWLMYLELDNKRYRDHLVHQFRVACIGHHFLKNDGKKNHIPFNILAKLNESKSVIGLCERLNLSSSDITSDDLDKAWWLSALFHDWGYLFTTFDKLEDKIEASFYTYNNDCINNFDLLFNNEEFKHTLVYKFFQDKLKNSCCFQHFTINRFDNDAHKCNNDKNFRDPQYLKWKTEKDKTEQKDAFEKLLHENVLNLMRRNLKNNHSVLGALNLLLTIEEISRKYIVTPKTWLIFNIAAITVLTHDFDDYKKFDGFTPEIDFEDYPLSFLLILCDQLQEWSRPVVKSDTDKNKVSIEFKDECCSIELNYDDIESSKKKLTINQKYINGFIEKNKKDIDEWKEKRKILFEKFFNYNGSPLKGVKVEVNYS